MIAAPTPRAKIASGSGRAWGSSTSRSSRMATRRDGARRPMSEQGAVDRPGRTAAILPGAHGRLRALRTGAGPTSPCDRCRRFMRPSRRDSTTVDPAAVRALVAAAAAAAVAGPVLAHGPVPAEPPTAASLLLGWTFAAAPDPRPSRRPSAGGSGRSAGSTRVHPRNPVPRRRTVAFLAGMLALAFALISGHRALRHEPVLGPHGPARPADARRRAAAGAGRADHPGPAPELRRDTPSLAPPVPPLARRAVPGASRSWPG